MNSNAGIASVAFMSSMLVMSCASVSSLVVSVNENWFDSLSVFDFLRIPGWGKTNDTLDPCTQKAETQCAASDNKATCIEDAVKACLSPDQQQTGSTPSWNFQRPFPQDCKDGARIACLYESKNRKKACTGTYKKLCVASGGTW